MKILFYEHRYLRDRQIDTVLGWPASDEVLNRAAFDRRKGAQVSKSSSLSPKSRMLLRFLRRIPVINFKFRRLLLSSDTVLFCWGSIPLWGRFIVELDNPYSLTGYNLSALGLMRPILRRFLLSRRCLEIRCISKACRTTLFRTLGQDLERKTSVVYPRLQSIEQPPPLICPAPIKFLFVATQFEMKGGQAILQAFSRLIECGIDVRLTMITYLPEKFIPISMHPNIEVLEPVFSRSEIVENFMRTHHVLLMPTMVESFGMVVLESMSAAMAVIASDCYAIPELLEDSVNGFVVSPQQKIWENFLPTHEYRQIQMGKFSVTPSTTNDLADQIYRAVTNLTPEVLLEMRKNSLIKFSQISGCRVSYKDC